MPPALVVFVTSTKLLGNMGGVSVADRTCNMLAHAAGFPAEAQFVAWLSTTTRSAVSRVAASGPWHLATVGRATTGALVASVMDLEGGALAHAIDVDENGASVSDRSVWTGTKADGSSDLSTCTDWATPGVGTVGTTGAIDGRWTITTPAQNCAGNTFSLYCFQLH